MQCQSIAAILEIRLHSPSGFPALQIEIEYSVRTLEFILMIYLTFYAAAAALVFLLPLRPRLKFPIWLGTFTLISGVMLGGSFYHIVYAYWFAATETERFNQAALGPAIQSLAIVNSHGFPRDGCDAHCAQAIVNGDFDLIEVPRDAMPSDEIEEDGIRWIPLWRAISARRSDHEHPCTGDWRTAAPAAYATGRPIPGEYCVRESVVREPASRYVAFQYQTLDRRGPPVRETPPFRRRFGIKVLDRVQGGVLVELRWFDYTAGRFLELGNPTVSVHPRLRVGERSFYASPMQLMTAWNTTSHHEPDTGAAHPRNDQRAQ